jgi:hypothetical protein
VFEPILVAEHLAECEWCGSDYVPKSSLAQFCSNACRLRARREREAVAR